MKELFDIFKKNKKVKITTSDKILNDQYRRYPTYPNVGIEAFKVPSDENRGSLDYIVRIRCLVRFLYDGVYYKTLYFRQTRGLDENMNDILSQSVSTCNKECQDIIKFYKPTGVTNEDTGLPFEFKDEYQQP